ncbi:hypothetical protein EDB84DRAFT_1612020 [Lactarius hengduanensis]|nr:hypothetical protein EDB84DRAFT_1615254 [Lactarius hengduanensis]KAH9025773.1 hypothetical protein EDB84DRAFT_1612020 [Lactarius hengduanensis]
MTMTGRSGDELRLLFADPASARSRLANPCTPLPPAPSAVVYGRDGSYLTESLLEKGYDAHDIIRRSSSFNTSRINLLFFGQHERAPQSHVEVSFDMAEYTGDVDALGTLRLLDAVRTCGLQNLVRFYQASTFELYSLVPRTTLMPRVTRSGLAQFIWSSSGSALQALNLPVNLYDRCVVLHGQDLTVYDNDSQTHDMTTSAVEIGRQGNHNSDDCNSDDDSCGDDDHMRQRGDNSGDSDKVPRRRRATTRAEATTTTTMEAAVATTMATVMGWH